MPTTSRRQWKFMKHLASKGGKDAKMAKEYIKDQPTPPEKKKK